MSDIDISLLRRLVDSALAANPDLQALAVPMMAAADSDGQPNEEDNILSESELENYVSRLRQESSNTLSILTRNREQLVGSLAAARTRLTDAGAPEALLHFLDLAAVQDEDHDNLSTEEIELLVNELTQQNDQAQQLDAATLATEMNNLLETLRQTEIEIPEAFLPVDEAAQRAPIDLNFLKNLPPTLFAGDDEQSVMLQNLLQMAGVDLTDPNVGNADWSLTFEEIQTFLAGLPEEARSGFPSTEVTMANFRFLAFTLRDEINAAMGAAVSEGGDAAELGVPLQVLVERRSEISDPRVDQLLEIAGDDGVLTQLDAERHLQRMEDENPGFLSGMLAEAPAAEGEPETDLQRAVALYLAGARALAADYATEPVGTATDAAAAPSFDRNLYISRQVLGDLARMRAGFTHRDRQYAEESSLSGTVDFVTWACTLGGALTWLGAGSPRTLSAEDAAEYGEDILPRVGPTYRNYMRESVEAHDHERGMALQALRRIIETPPADFSGDRTIPNALEYLRTHPAITESSDGFDRWEAELNQRYYESLTGDLFQAERLWRIRSETDPARVEEMWFSLAQDLREGYSAFWRADAHLDCIDNLDFARAILHALHRETTDVAMRNRAHHTLQDSLGQAITDDTEAHNVLEEGGGEFGIWPPDWFRNYSDENVDAVASDVILLVASLLVGGGGFSAARGAMTAAGRTALTAGLLRFIGIRGTQVVVTAGADAAAVEGTAAGSGWFGRIMASWAARRVATAEASLATATTEAEATAARQALTRAQSVQRILTSPTVTGTIAETVAPNATRWWTRVAAAHPPISEGLVNAAAGTGTRAALARASVAALENVSLRGLGRSLHWLSYEGIVSYGIAGYVFQSYPRHSNHPLIFDREYELSLPERVPVRAPDPAAH